MPKKWKSSVLRSALLHGILLLMIGLLVYHPHEDPGTTPPIAIETISIKKEVKKAIHSMVHSIGIPHREPDVPEAEDPAAPSAPPLTPPSEKPLSAANEVAGGALEVNANSGSEMQDYLAEVIRRIDSRKRYPKSARFNEQEGLVQVRMELAPDGTLIASEIEKPCAFSVLNDSALQAVRSIGALPPLPAAHSTKNVVLHVPIHFRIER